MLQYKNHFQKLELLRANKLSLKKNVQDFLTSIAKSKNLNAFNFVFEDCLDNAEIIQKKIITGEAGKLAGMVIAIKDVLSIKDKPLTCSSKILGNFNSIYTATAVQKLINQDAIIIGKTNCDEFAMGSSNENSAFGPVLNPHDNSKVPGGSSGGSAVSVAAKLCDAALGTDTGGSIRQPAAFCGVFGLKPTYGKVSRFGLTAYGSSFDTIGPFSNSVEDTALILEVISGKDEKDSTSAESEKINYSNSLTTDKKFKIGIPKEFFGAGLNQEINVAIHNILNKLKSEGHEIIDVSLPLSEYSIPTYYILATAEASSNLARYDGAHFGFRSKDTPNLKELYTNSRTEGFGKEVKRRIMLGTYVLSAGYYDAYYNKAQKVRRLLKESYDKVFKNVEIILTPTTPTTAFNLGEKSNDPLEMYLTDIYTTSANLVGIPGMNIPVGFDNKKMPIGMQLMANQFNEIAILQLGKVISEL
ncbi:MAG: Asp-tRNA(Asn)/Glu-tRNA(Gln) amidotransferase subunit GatA [Ignavibacteria bacterium]|nr:Asp-tRNA(Asn)/Glu-tRNA(Gln) amidotransferase subunit GatA [Ignavibacteria bacterium]